MRYLAIMEFYVYADSEVEASEIANEVAKDHDMENDSKASITLLKEAQWGIIPTEPRFFF